MFKTLLIVLLTLSCKKSDSSSSSSSGDSPTGSTNNSLNWTTLNAPPTGTLNRSDILNVNDFYLKNYKPGIGMIPKWNGNTKGCNAGQVEIASLKAALLRINYFRAMTGTTSDLQLDSKLTSISQETTLVLSANNYIGHSLPSSLLCYSTEAASGAASSNLFFKTGTEAVDGFIEDFGWGDTNAHVGHRRWLLYPKLVKIGIGMVPGDLQKPSMAIHVTQGTSSGVVDHPTAWPPAGYVPRSLVYGRWSYSHPSADWTSTKIYLTYQGVQSEVPVLKKVNQPGTNTITWSPSTLGPGGVINNFDVKLDNIKVNTDNISVFYTSNFFPIGLSNTELTSLNKSITDAPVRTIFLDNKPTSPLSYSRSSACGKLTFDDVNLTVKLSLDHGVKTPTLLILNTISGGVKTSVKEIAISGYATTQNIILNKTDYDRFKSGNGSIAIASTTYPAGEIEGSPVAKPLSEFCQVIKPNFY